LLHSMTAFGRGQSHGENEDFLVEIHSVNHRRLEIVLNIPGELTEFDPPLRKLIGAALSRGRISLFVSVQPAYDRAKAFRLNTDMARQLKKAYDELRTSLGYDGEVDFSIIASRPDLIVSGSLPADPQTRWTALKAAAQAALHELLAMKKIEGDNLRKGFDESLSELDKIVASVEEIAPAALQKHIHRLKERVSEATSELADNQDRVLREIAIFADKLDLSEEVARLKSHIAQFRTFMDDAKPSGRTMDFLVQEMNREINTIGAKADDLTVSRMVVRGKTELEKIREQAQNIE
jgi:uncharacterized protein (TIGR00255 family)